MTETPDPELLREVTAASWYHTLELPGGVLTRGRYDLRGALGRLPLPASLDGRRCLDIGTHDGFWALEMERRGAAEVIAIDLDEPERLDWPAPAPKLDAAARTEYAAHRCAFELAHRARCSRVQRISLSVYDVASGDLGEFDFATIGTLLLHLRDPIAALAAVRGVLRGELLCNDVVSPLLSALWPRRPAARLARLPGEPFWWMPNLAGLRRYLTAAGYRILRSGGPYLVPNGPGRRPPPLRLVGTPEQRLPRQLLLRRGMPHGWALARPAS